MKKKIFVCGNCATEVNDSAAFCTECGFKLKPIEDKDEILDLNNLGRYRKADQALRDVLTHLGVFSHIPELKQYEDDAMKLQAEIEKFLKKVGKPKITSDSAEGLDDAGPLKEENKEKIKEKVKALLIKYGNNPKDVEKMIKQEFEGAFNTWKKSGATPAKIAEYIRSVY